MVYCIHVLQQNNALTLHKRLHEWVTVVYGQMNNCSAISLREEVAFRWDDDEVRFVLDQHAELILYSSNSLKQQSTGRHVGRFGALKSDSTHHFFRNACTKLGSLRFSQFSGWLILSVYIIMSFDFPFVRLFGVR